MATAKLYGLALVSAFNKEIDWNSDDIRVMLVGTGYTPDQDTHQYLSSVVAQEVSGTGYTAGGVALTSESISYDTATNKLKLDADDAVFTAVTLSPGPRYAVVYDRTPATDATRPLIGYVDFGAATPVAGGDLTVRWNSDGTVSITVS